MATKWLGVLIALAAGIFIHQASAQAGPCEEWKGDDPAKKEECIAYSGACAALRKAPDDVVLRRDCIKSRLQPGGGAQGAVVTDLLQVVGQIVVDRVSEAALSGVTEQVKALLQCERSPLDFPTVCDLLKMDQLQALIASPNTLLYAVEADLTALAWKHISSDAELQQALAAGGAILNVALAEAAPVWKHEGPQTISDALLKKIRAEMLKAVDTVSCGDMPQGLATQQAIWMVEECIAQGRESPLNNSLKECNAEKLASTCPPADAAMRSRLFSYLVNALTADKPLVAARYIAMFSLDAAQAHLAQKPGLDDAAKKIRIETLENLKAMLIGFLALDWVRATTGGAALMGSLVKLHGGDATIPRPAQRFFQFVAAVGQYAATYSQSGDPAAAQAARKQVLQAFIKSQTSRTNRSSWVFSLGGSFGFGGAYRRSFDGQTSGAVAPVLLPLGIATQSYWRCKGFPFGLHLQVGILDLGQYVSFEGGTAKVGTPNVGNALAPSVTAGWWIWKPEVPFFIAAHAGVNPFVRSDGNPEWFAGGMVGAYVPFIDFN